MRASAVLAVLLAVVLAPDTTVTALDFRPVDSALLSGRTLRVEAENFSIEAPDGWMWPMADLPDGYLYLCRPESDARVFVILFQADGRRRALPRSVNSFINGLTRSLEEQ